MPFFADWEPWRTEADDAWLAAHSSDTFARIRAYLSPLVGPADALSQSPVSAILGGAPRNPVLRVRDIQAEHVRYAEQRYAYTTVTVTRSLCRRCGDVVQQIYRLARVDEAGRRDEWGSVRACGRCDAESWMFKSHMPSAVALRKARAMYVL